MQIVGISPNFSGNTYAAGVKASGTIEVAPGGCTFIVV